MKFCPECGTRAEGFKFCPECGYKLTGGETAAAGAPKTDDIFGGAFGTDTFAKNDFFGGGIDDFDWGGAAQARTRDVEIQQEMDALSVFECEKHQNGKYAILSLKNAMEMSITVPACVEAIADGAFEGSDLLEVTLSEGLVKIGNRAFANCRELTKIRFPRSLKFIGNEAFAYCVNLDVEAPERARVGYKAFVGTLGEKRMREQAEAAERTRREAEEAERRRKAAEEAERARREAEEAERRRKAAEEAERKRREAEKAERRRREAEEAAHTARLRELYNKGKRLYDNGDYGEALEYLREAAEQGYADAQYILGYSYISAQGVGYNSAEAKRWFRKAAEQGHALAKSWLNDMNQWGW
ncbi:MAG: hypothetical protein E7608_06305 [Ruminococcaceae bacterium]|nr:hypothetical protein [Oscillospiraceae bacterium]